MKNRTNPRTPRFGDYIVTRSTGLHKDQMLPQPERPARPALQRPERWQVLWAEKPLELPDCRALGIRKRGTELEVALVPKATLTLQWVPAEKALTSKQVRFWGLQTGFLPA